MHFEPTEPLEYSDSLQIVSSDTAHPVQFVRVHGIFLTTGIPGESSTALPSGYQISAVYPNPFNAEAHLQIALPQRAYLSIQLYDALGRRVATLAENSFSAGSHRFRLNGSELASGRYFVRISIPAVITEVRPAIYIR